MGKRRNVNLHTMMFVACSSLALLLVASESRKSIQSWWPETIAKMFTDHQPSQIVRHDNQALNISMLDSESPGSRRKSWGPSLTSINEYQQTVRSITIRNGEASINPVGGPYTIYEAPSGNLTQITRSSQHGVDTTGEEPDACVTSQTWYSIPKSLSARTIVEYNSRQSGAEHHVSDIHSHAEDEIEARESNSLHGRDATNRQPAGSTNPLTAAMARTGQKPADPTDSHLTGMDQDNVIITQKGQLGLVVFFAVACALL